MTTRRGVRRRVLPMILLLCPAGAAAQVEPPVRDSTDAPVAAAPDSVPARPLQRLPSMAVQPTAAFAGVDWVWDRDALLREGAVTLSDLLERIPNVTTLRAGVFGQPEAAASFGGTSARTEIVIDGFVLDPLAAASLDLSQIPLGQLREVHVQRRLGLLRIVLATERPFTDQPYTRVEAGIGEPSGSLFRGTFMVPHVIVGPLGLGIERLDTDGTGRNEPADAFSGWAKWSWTRERRGVQFEWLRTTLRRHPDSPWLTDRVRQDMLVRARNMFATGLVAEVYAGRSTLAETLPTEPLDEDEEALPDIDRESVQAGARATWESPYGVIGGALRYRDAAFLPSTEATLDASLSLGPIRAAGEVGRASWRDADATSYSSLYVEVGRFLGAGAFAEITQGSRGGPAHAAPFIDEGNGEGGEESDAVTEPPLTIMTSRDGWRAGVQMDIGTRASGRLAYVSLDQDRSRPFGLPFDSGGASIVPGRARGVEAYGRLVLIPGLLAIESWITDWQEATGWLYMPVRSWRTALEVHTLPLESGNLEILARLEGSQRSGMLVHDPEGTDEAPFTAVPGFTVYSGYLQIRVIDVRAFLRWEDLLGANAEPLPGRVLRGPRIFYGVKWNLWN